MLAWHAFDRLAGHGDGASVGFSSPAMAFSMVLLPQPVGPTMATKLAIAHRQVDVPNRDIVAEGHGQPVEMSTVVFRGGDGGLGDSLARHTSLFHHCISMISSPCSSFRRRHSYRSAKVDLVRPTAWLKVLARSAGS